MRAKIIALLIATTCVILLMVVYHDGVIMLHSQVMDFMERIRYNNTFRTLLPITGTKDLNDKLPDIKRLNKKNSAIKERNDIIINRKNRKSAITYTETRSKTITNSKSRNNTILGKMNTNGLSFHIDTHRNSSQHNLKIASAGPDIPNTSQLIKQSARPGNTKTIYLKFIGRLGNMLFEFAGIYGLKRTTNSQVRFMQNRLIQKLIKLFPRTKPLLKTVHILPSGLLKLKERKGGEFDPSLARKITAAKSDVQVSRYLSRLFF